MTFVDPVLNADQFLRQEMQGANSNAIEGFDANPDDAVRAQEIADVLGVPAPVVDADLEHYDRHARTQLTRSILDSNFELQQYVNSNPLAAKVSNDDFAQLDSVSGSVRKFSAKSILNAATEGFAAGYDKTWTDEEFKRYQEWLDKNPVLGNFVFRQAAEAIGGGLLLGDQLAVGGLAGTAAGLGELYKQMGGDEAWADRLTRDLFQLMQVGIAYPMARPTGVMPRVNKQINQVVESLRPLEPYIREGKEPPFGIHPLTDQIKIEQANLDAENLAGALKEAMTSATRERSPELFASFLRQHTDGEIGVSADAVRQLYGDKVPEPDDGLLGWVPRLQEQLEIAEATGGDIRIPVADWLAKVEPEVAKGLEEFIRFREGGVTKAEAAEGIEVWHGSGAEFEAFSADKIGTGEGAQSYGYGHYLAENPEVAQSYQRTTPDSAKFDPDKVGGGKEGGQLYKARILRQPEEFLDWDLPLWEQGDAGKRIVEAISQDPELVAHFEDFGGIKDLNAATGAQVVKSLEAYTEYAKLIEGFKGTASAEASLFLESLDLPGIKYLDQFSRAGIKHEQRLAEIRSEMDTLERKGAENLLKEEMDHWEALDAERQQLLQDTSGTRNFVVFSERDIEITHRNGEAVRALREATALQPKAEPREFTLRAVGEPTADGRHAFEILDQQGKPIGHVALALENGGKRIYIDDMGADLGPRTLGPRGIHDLALQIKEMFPQAETVEGMRVSGARERAHVEQPKALKVKLDLAKIKPRKRPEQLELDVTRLEDREAFEKGAAIGMTAEQYRRYQALITKRLAEDQAYFTKKAVEDARRKLTPAWKENEVKVRSEVVDEFKLRRDLAAEDFFREGLLFGDRTGHRGRINPEGLSPEELAAFPKEYLSEKGLLADDAAALLGYPDRTAMINEVAAVVADRKAAGMRPMDHRRALIQAEVDRRMRERHGDLSEQIIEEAKERVLSETQIDMLHEEALAAAFEAGLEFSITKEQFLSAVRTKFTELPLRDAKSDRFLADAGRANRAAEMALLRGDPTEAFRQKQRGYMASVMAREAIGVEKRVAQFEKTAKKFAAREVKGIAQDATNFVQALLSEAGVPLKVSKQEIAAAMDFEGHKSLRQWVDEKVSFGWEPEVVDRIMDDGPSTLEQMTVEQFREFKDAIDSLAFIGRQEKKIEIAGREMEWAAFQDEVIGKISTLPVRPRESQGRWIYELDASLTRMEQIVKDLDLREELGPMFRAVIEPMMMSKAKEFDLVTDLAKHFREVKGKFGRKWRKSLADTIPQDFLIDPYYGVPYDLSRENMIQIMLNWGNRSNIEKFSRGYASLQLGRKATKEEAAAFAGQVKSMIDKHATKEDWDFVKAMWEPFKKYQPMADTVARNVSGVAPKWIAPDPVETPFGVLDGGYWPVKYDRLGSDLEVIKERKPGADQLFGPDYFRAATAKGHLRERTNYIDFVDITTSIEQVAGVMQQTIHDIAYRDALIQAGRVFYDKKIRAAIRKHYGTEYEAQLVPWLKRIANKNVVDDRAVKWYNDFARRIRVNLVGSVLPLNLKVILSPDVGVPNPKAWASFEANRSRNTEFALTHSNEIRHLIYNLDRDFREQIEQLYRKGKFSAFQRSAVEWGFVPMMKMTQEFRMSTFIDQYEKARAEGRSHQEAIDIGDYYVRERHGAASVVDLPAIMQSSEVMKSLTMFYTFFNTMYNWQRQLPGNVRRREFKKFGINALGSIVVGATFGAALFNKADEDDSWFKTIGKALLLQPLSTIPVMREAVNYWLEGYNPRTPLMALLDTIGMTAKEFERAWEGKAPKRPIQAGSNIVGFTTGLPLSQLGRTGQFLFDVHQGKQRPRNVLEWINGIIHGRTERRG